MFSSVFVYANVYWMSMVALGTQLHICADVHIIPDLKATLRYVVGL
jgi:hypothetical protein